MKLLSKASLAILTAVTLSTALVAEAPERAKVQFLDHSDKTVGKADIRQGPDGVVIRVELEGLEPGWKAIHIHATGDCHDHDEGFQASGGHLDPDDRKHGLLHPEGPERGDLPNIWVNEDGEVRAEMHAHGVSIGQHEQHAALLDEDGAALVVHEGPDDHKSQPIGGAGSRVACGVVEAAE